MAKLRHSISLLFFLFICGLTRAQDKYTIHLRGVDKDSAYLVNSVGIQTAFSSQMGLIEYVNRLPSILQTKGYVTASVDSVRYETNFAEVFLFLGEAYHWVELRTTKTDAPILNAVGWKEKNFSSRPMDFEQVKAWKEKLLDWLENNGYPFGKIYLDSLRLDSDRAYADLKIDTGPLYKIDSIRLFGNAKLSPNFIHRYLDIADGSVYKKEKLQLISEKIRNLGYVEEEKPSDLSMLPTGSVLNLYLRSKRSSQVNILFGFLPNSDQFSDKKLLITGEANLNLKNAFGGGEVIGFNFQKLQVRSQRLNFLYQHPYLFDSPVGLDIIFDMYRRDSVYLNINMQAGANYILSNQQSGKIYIQRFQTIANGVNTAFVVLNHRLPDEADVSAFNVGVDYDINTTDYIRNPRKGNEFLISTTIGTKKIKRNDLVLQLKDPNDPGFDFASLYDTVKTKTYQFRVRVVAAKYFPLAKLSTLKAAINGGYFHSGHTFRNELFQVGGFKLLRGFDEESQYFSQYAIGTVEYHYFIGLNSYFYALVDGGWGKNKSQNVNIDHGYLSTGLGLAFETKAGIFNLAWAIGKRDDLPFNLRQSKIHFGFVNYF